MSRKTVEKALERAERIIALEATNDDETRLADALADLRHWAEAHNENFYAALRRSDEYYLDEREET